MTLDDLKNLKGSSALPFPITSKEVKWHTLNINHKIALPIVAVASNYSSVADIPIYDHTGSEVAVLCFTKELGKRTWHELTSDQFIAFLKEVDYADRTDFHAFEFNYIIIKDSFYEEYVRDYKETSPLWGGFAHYHPDIKTANHLVTTTSIQLRKLRLDPKIFLENATRAIAQPYGFERFLKLYHLLELRFDYDVIKNIKDIDVDVNPEEIGRLLNDYSRTEFPRLNDIIVRYCLDITPIVNRLNDLRRYPQLVEDLLFKFGTGKDYNPFKSQQVHFNNVLPLGFEQHNLMAQHVSFQANYPKFILTFAAFVIYRIRCSIAHNKIGEYILSMDQEDFIVEVGEPILNEVLFQCFKS